MHVTARGVPAGPAIQEVETKPDKRRQVEWAGLDRLIDRARSLDDLRAHRLELLAARRSRELGRDVPDALALHELISLQRLGATSLALRAARDACTQRMVVLKGPAAAAHYPDPALRPFTDLDVLVEDPAKAQRELLAAGFQPTGDFDDGYYEGLHHVRPLRMAGHDTPEIELHRRPNWVDFVDPPATEELLSVAVPGLHHVPGVLVLPPEHHALLLAAHSWGEAPLRRILDLVDVIAVSDHADIEELHRIAKKWQLDRLWKTTIAVAEAVVIGEGDPWSMRLWARDLRSARDRTVLENHLRRWLSPFWALPLHKAIAGAGRALVRDLTPAPSETWENKVSRLREALFHPARPQAEHQRILGPGGVHPRFKRR
jgi:hypothetical protein